MTSDPTMTTMVRLLPVLVAATLLALAVVAIVFGMVTLLRRRPDWRMPAAWIAMTLVLVVAFMGAGVWLFVRVPAMEPRPTAWVEFDPPVAPSTAAREPSRVHRITTGGEAWAPEVEETFDADVYPSLELAAQALGRRIAPQLGDVSRVYVALDSLATVPSPVAALGEGLRDTLPEVTVRIDHDPGHELAEDHVRVQLQLDVRSTRPAPWASPPPAQEEPVEDRLGRGRPPWPQEQRSAVLRAFVAGQETRVRFIDKPWVARPSEFLPQHSQRLWLMARSPRFADGESEALDAAYEAAMGQLVGEEPREPQSSLRRAGEDLIVDRFVQRLSRPYGDVWRAAVLVDVSPERLAEVADAVAQTRQAALAQRAEQRQNWAWTILSIAGLVVVIFVVYAVLDAVTSGYFRPALRVALVVIGGVGVIVMLLLVA